MITVAQLDRSEAAAYADFTFPSLRPLIDAEREPPPFLLGAHADGDPIGFAVGLAAPNRQFDLISLYVAPLWRRQGIGSRLLRAIEEHYRAEGCTLGAHFYTISETDRSAAHFLIANRWSRPTVRQVICQTTTALILGSPLRAFARLPRGYKIVGWGEVSAAQKAAIRERSTREPDWFPAQLDPFVNERDCVIDVSIALLHGDAVVGWLFSHAIDAQTLRMTCSFVAKELQRLGRVLHLWWEAGVRQDARTTMQRTIWTIPVAYGNHVQFVLKHVKPWMEAVSYACTSLRCFDDPESVAREDLGSEHLP